ncbi:MAG: glucose-6-phosphate dehydrogenase [Rectinemataceae bacterium]|jgi:glucose-6-phosphate 1-dehydrogenase
MPDNNEEYGYCDLSGNALEPEAAAIVVFGATGDLARRKIFPALYNLERMGILPPETLVIGFARRELSQEDFLAQMRESCALFSHSKPLDEAAWERLARRVSYQRGSFDDETAYRALALRLAEPGVPANALFYLAVAPEEFAAVARGLSSAELGCDSVRRALGECGAIRRLVVEKPFGRDRESARTLNATLQGCFAEEDIFRIDHYLGKETVQNLLYFRFANSIFEPLWNRNHIQSVEIDVLETGGIGSRGGYYDKAGAARDMLQNHLIQLLCLVAMEPPAGLDPESVRNEKVKVLKSIRDYSSAELLARSRRGQYSAGRAANGSSLPAYVDEERVAPGSATETFVSLKLEVDNWRFAGVPFTLRTGKALDRQVSEIRVTFNRPPATLFSGYCGDLLSPNVLTLRIQPDEGMWLGFNAKQPGAARVVPKELRFSYRERNDAYFPEAYERLIADALAGDSTLFIRSDEAEEAWRIVDALESAWAAGPSPKLYPAGSSGL